MDSYVENVKEDEQMYEDGAVEIKEEMEYGKWFQEQMGSQPTIL